MAQAQGQGRTLGMYQLGPFVGSGPVGDVYRARHLSQEPTDVALKVLRQPFAGSPNVRSRLNQISAFMANVDHPHILPLEFAGESDGRLFTVTPLVAHGSLMARLARGRLSPKDIAPLFKQMCDALAFAHGMGLVHGNIKPTNIMLFEGKHVLLGDFGHLWQIAEVDLTRSGINADAVLYMAPEQVDGVTDARSDIYSLGVVLFHALTGSPPFTGKTPFEVLSRHQRQPAPTLTAAQGLLPPGALVFDEVIRMALAKDPSARFQSPVALARALVEAGNLANDLPSRVMPSLRPNSVPLIAPPQQRAMPPSYPQPGMMPPGYGQPPPSPMSGPAAPQYQQPMRPPGVPPLPPGMPPQAPPDDPLSWLLPDATPAPPSMSRPNNRPINQDLADFLTARHAAPTDSVMRDAVPPSTAETGSVPAPTGETGSISRAEDPWWQSEAASREYTGYTDSRVPSASREWEVTGEFDQSRSMQAPSLRRPARNGAERDRWEESDPDRSRNRRNRRDDTDYSAEMSRARPATPSRPRRDAYDYDEGRSRSGPAVNHRSSRARAPAPPKKSRLPGVLAALVLIFLLLSAGLIITFKPSLCPNHVCDSLHTKIQHLIKGSDAGLAPFALRSSAGTPVFTITTGDVTAR